MGYREVSQGMGAAATIAGATGFGMPIALGLGAGSSLLKYWGDSNEADRQRQGIEDAYKPIEDTSAIDRQAAARKAGSITTAAGRGAQRQMAASGLTSSGAAASAAGEAQGRGNDYLQQENDQISRVQERLKTVNSQMKQAMELKKLGINVNMADYIAPALQIGMGVHKAFNPQAYLPQGGQGGQEGYGQQPAPQIPQQAVQNQSMQPQGLGVQNPNLPNGLLNQNQGMQIPFEAPWYQQPQLPQQPPPRAFSPRGSTYQYGGG